MVLVEPVAFGSVVRECVPPCAVVVVFVLPVAFVAVVFGLPVAFVLTVVFGAPLPCAAAPLAEPISTTAHAIETIALMGTSAKARLGLPGRARSHQPEQRLCPSSAGAAKFPPMNT